MATVVQYKWVSRPSSRRRGGVIINRPLKERMTRRVILAPPPSWYTFGERRQERPRVLYYLHAVLRNVRAATRDFTVKPVDPLGELSASVCAAQLVIQHVCISAIAQQTCLMCGSLVAAERLPRSRIPARVSMEASHISSHSGWTLHEIRIYPSWREDLLHASPPRLCTVHESEFTKALNAVLLDIIVPPDSRALDA